MSTPAHIPNPADLDLSRVAVVGTTNSGKSTFAAALSRALDLPFVELDAHNWGPNWQERDNEEFRRLVAADTAGDRWASAGNYSRVRDLVLDRATTVFWLNYPIYVNLYRLTKRTIYNLATRKVVFSGNVETLATTFSRDSLFIWIFKSYYVRREKYNELFKTGYHGQARVIIFTKPKQADTFLNSLHSELENATI